MAEKLRKRRKWIKAEEEKEIVILKNLKKEMEEKSMKVKTRIEEGKKKADNDAAWMEAKEVKKMVERAMKE